MVLSTWDFNFVAKRCIYRSRIEAKAKISSDKFFFSHSLTFVPQVNVSALKRMSRVLSEICLEGDHGNAKALRADYTTVHPSQHIWGWGWTVGSAQRGID